jgi:ketosteroid isomerase-like protein
MKTRLLGALVGLAINFAVPTFAQEKETVDPQMIEKVNAVGKKYDEAMNNNDAAAVAALYTEDAVRVTDTGPIYGREAIEKYWADFFKQFHFIYHLDRADQNSPHSLGTASNEAWSNGEWAVTFQYNGGPPTQAKGYWLKIYRRQGDTWKTCADAGFKER